MGNSKRKKLFTFGAIIKTTFEKKNVIMRNSKMKKLFTFGDIIKTTFEKKT